MRRPRSDPGPSSFAPGNDGALSCGMKRRHVGIALLTACAALAPAGTAQQTGSAGAIDWFGRGIVAVQRSGTEVRLDLRTEAQGMLLRLAQGEPITIVAVGPFAAGESVVRLPPAQPPAARAAPAPQRSTSIAVRTNRQAPPAADPPREAPQEYLLLVLCDRTPDSAVTDRIRRVPGFDPVTAAHDLTEFLVGRQSPMWAGYLARR